MELSNYIVDHNGKLALYSNATKKKYTVWGIGPHGLIHGVGAYLKREDYKNKGIDITIINEPTYQEIEEYYNFLNGLNLFDE